MNVIDLLTAPWAIMPARLEEMTRIYSAHLQGDKTNIEALEARAGQPLERRQQGYTVHNGVAVIPIEGVIAKKMNMFHQISGGASTQLIERDFLQAMADEKVHSIILHADTPGGSVDGTAELAKVIFEARGKKPIFTLADGLMASAGVWIGTAADSVYITSETTTIGAIGVVTQHVDYSEADKKRGIKVTEIYAGKYKRLATETEPLSEEGREYLQSHVDYVYSIFVDTVAKHRGATIEDVLENMADGRIFIGQHAVNAGLVDGVATLDQLIDELADANNLTSAFTDGTTHMVPPTSPLDSSHAGKQAGILEKLPEDLAQAFEAGLAAGATQEHDRIQAVRSWQGAFSGAHKALIEELAFDGTTTKEEAASLIIKAEKEKKAAMARARSIDAAELDGVSASVELERERQDKTDADVDMATAKLKGKWESNRSLRADFGDNFDRYKAFAENRLKVVNVH